MPDALLHHSDRDTPPDEATPDWDNSPSFYCFNFLTQGVDDLQLALLAVAVVAELGQLAAAPLHIARRHVVEHQRAGAQMLASERLLDRLLALAQPVERDIKLVLVDRSQSERLAEAEGRGERVEHAGGGEFGSRCDQPRHNHRNDEVAAAVASRPKQTIETDVAQRAEHGRHMPVRQRAMTGEMFLAYIEQCLVPTLKRNDIVVMDNCRVHLPPGIWEAIEKAWATLRYLPKYSPDLNPIEMPYSKFKAFLRKVAARTVSGLKRAIHSFIPQLSPQECANYFSHAGYASI